MRIVLCLAVIGCGASAKPDAPSATNPPDAQASVRAPQPDLVFGHGRACARTASRAVTCWPISRGIAVGEPTAVAGLDRVRSVAMSIDTLLVTRDDGSLWRWDGRGAPSTIADRGVAMVAAFAGLVCVLDEHGAVGCWGEGGNQTLAGTPQPVPGAPALVDVRVGLPTTCGMTASGDIWCWQVGHGPPGQATRVALTHPSSAIAVDGWHACAASNGAVECWGSTMTADPASVGCQQREHLRGGPSFWAWEDCPPHRLAGLSEVAALTIVDSRVIATTTGGDVVSWQRDRVTPLAGAAGLTGIAARPVSTGLEVCGWSADDALTCLGDPPVVSPTTQPGPWVMRLP